jgi:2-keto-4-pentenoate hydratase/2-oxohepta-3-ene-1,7-dioic acid hydratase in catechol pathway
MKLISFKHKGKNSFGAVTGDKVIDLQTAFAGRATDLKSLIAANLVAEASAFIKTAQASIALADVEFLPVIPNPGKIVCVGLNYGEHVRETGREITESPALFLRLNESQVAHGQDIIRPPESHRLDYEGEIAG